MTRLSTAYWQAKSGHDYQRTQKERGLRGLAAYDRQMDLLRSILTERLSSTQGRLRLLDYGCGFGRVAHLCDEIGAIDYYGYDISSSMVEGLRDNPPVSLANNLNERLCVGEELSACFTGVRFDIILTISVLIHNNETDARAILEDATRLIEQNGEIVLIENELARESRFTNLWHGGCWAHDLASYADRRMALHIDSDSLPGHAVYRMRRPLPGQPLITLVKNGQSAAYETLEQLHADAPDAYAEADPTHGLDHELAIAQLLDAKEQLGYEGEKRAQLERLVDQLQDKLTRLEDQFSLGTRIRASLIEPKAGQSDKQALQGRSKPTKARLAEPTYIFDAARDRQYAHPDHPAFADVLTVCTQEWVGIRAASGSFPGPKLAITKCRDWSAAELVPIFDRISAMGTKKVLAQGLSSGLESFLVALRAAMPDLNIYGVWHGTLAAWTHDEERMLANRFLSLASKGVYNKIHFLKRGMHLLHPKAFAPLLPNPVPRIENVRLRPAFEKRPLTCLFGGWNNAWKNMYANILGAAASEKVGKVFCYATMNYGGPGHKKVAVSPFSSRANHFALCSTCDLVLNATIVDCHPMLELEGLAVGTPSLRSDLDLDFGKHHAYERLFTVASPHNPLGIKERLDELAGVDPAEVADVVADYRELVTDKSFERYGEFLEG